MEIIYEDDEKIILNKAAGQLVQSGKSFDLDLVSEVMNYRRKKGEPPYAAVINRLDRPVSGVVLMAKNKESAARYSGIMQKQGFCKRYYAVVHGKMDEKKAVLSDYLIKTRDNTAAISDKSCKEAKFAELDYEVVREITLNGGKSQKIEADGSSENKNCEWQMVTFLKINLHTGRFHQIRAQLASRGHAIVGDTKYGAIFGTNCGTDSGLKQISTGKDLRAAAADLCLKPREIALCAHSLTVDGTEYTVTPPWWRTEDL